MKKIIFLLLFCVACDDPEAQAIRQCGYACSSNDSHRNMIKYSKTEGCVCGDKP